MTIAGTDKSELRRLVRQRRQELSAGDAGAERCRRIQKRLMESEFWQRCRLVVLYISVKGEADTSMLLSEAWNSGKTVFLPRCRPEEPGIMDMIACRGRDELQPSRFGIPEPVFDSGSRLLSKAERDDAGTLVVVPALTFDRKGFRLGYGGGYYDRFLEGSHCLSTGLAFHDLLVDRLPHDAWDRPVGAVCTEEEFLCL